MCPRQAQGSAASSLGNSTVATDTKEDPWASLHSNKRYLAFNRR
jgi:hypothetical protein